MRPNGQKVLITGADGFIGSHLTEYAVKSGYRVKAFVLYNSFNTWGWLDHISTDIIKEIEVYAGDIRDFHGVAEAMKGCHVVMHLAALVGIPYSYYSPDSYVDTNIKGTLNILQAARKLNVDKIVHTSSSEVYGSAQFVPIHEEHPLRGQSPYAASKIAADQMAMAFHYSFNMPVSVIRPFNTYGPRQSARAVIPTIISQIVDGQREVKLGNIYPTRDFNYIKDTVRGFLAVAESDAAVGQVINLGSNYEISIARLADMIAEIMRVELELQSDAMRLRPEKSEVDRLWADNRKAVQILDWKPEYAGYEGLQRGLTETVEWFRDPSNLKKYRSNIYNL